MPPIRRPGNCDNFAAELRKNRTMEWLNYHHLLYFWTVAREGGVAAAGRRLRLSQSSISAQLRLLEARLGQPLFDRAGKRLQLTEAGRVAFRYADEIFGLGRELLDTVQGRPGGRTVRLSVGLTDAMHKLIAYRLLEPALQLPEAVQVHCEEDRLERLLPRLTAHELDLVLSDVPLPPGAHIRAFNHPLGHSEVTIFAAPALAARLRPGFPASLDRAPMLLPAGAGALRRELERWFDQLEIRPQVVGEFDDSALLKVFGQNGAGAFAAPRVVAREICRQYKVRPVGDATGLVERYFAISVERRLKHPGVVAISSAARSELFQG
jgi:LysR family transcriptional activator of nhaA